MEGLDCLGADSSPAPSLDDVRQGLHVIGVGMKGDSVMYVQGLVGAVADGVFGAKTETAVKAFQRAHGLNDDGIVDSTTIAALDILAGGATQGVSKISFGPSSSSAPAAVAKSTPAARAAQASGAMGPRQQPSASWWMQPAWNNGPERWKAGAAGGAGALGLGALLWAWLG
jgi:peptidoglycan hydrolase-like protein with peptidoglycan-binding domain